MQNRHRELIGAIEAILHDGVLIDAGTAAYIDSSYSSPSTEELAAVLADRSGPERDTLCELLFFPDETMQLRLEPILEQNKYSPADAAAVAAALRRRTPAAVLRFHDGRAPLRISMPAEIVESFVTRLKLAVRIEPRLRHTIETCVAAERQNHVKVRLRNARRMPQENKRDFLSAFIEKQSSDRAFMADLEFLLGVFEEFDDRSDLYSALSAKKRACALNLIKHQRREERLKNETMETLLARGERIPYLDKAAARESIDRIDRICLGVCGKTESIRDLVPSEDRVRCSDIDDLKELVRRLL